MEEGQDPLTASERGGEEVALAVLAATFTTAIVFFPVMFLFGISRYLFTALALAVVLALAASYLVAMSVVPLFCARFIKSVHGAVGHHSRKSVFGRLVSNFNRKYDQMLMHYDAVSAAGSCILPPYRSRAICHQRESSDGRTPGSDQ
jgi:multidrug efflux pump subunit AcrB